MKQAGWRSALSPVALIKLAQAENIYRFVPQAVLLGSKAAAHCESAELELSAFALCPCTNPIKNWEPA